MMHPSEEYVPLIQFPFVCYWYFFHQRDKLTYWKPSGKPNHSLSSPVWFSGMSYTFLNCFRCKCSYKTRDIFIPPPRPVPPPPLAELWGCDKWVWVSEWGKGCISTRVGTHYSQVDWRKVIWNTLLRDIRHCLVQELYPWLYDWRD